MFTEQELAELDALLGSVTIDPVKKTKAKAVKSKPVVKQSAPVPHLETPVPVGLVLLVERILCTCCLKREKRVLGVMVKYSYKGAVVKKPLNEMTGCDYSRLVNEKRGIRETEEGEIKEVVKCAECSETSLRMWEKLGVFA